MSWSHDLSAWLRRPSITVYFEPTDRVRELESRVEKLTAECTRLAALYARECDTTMALSDTLRQHGIKWR